MKESLLQVISQITDQDHPVQIKVVSKDKSKLISSFFVAIHEIPQVIEEVNFLYKNNHIFWNPNCGSKFIHFTMDFDNVPDTFPDKILEIVDSPKPTMILKTAKGYHLIWILNRPLPPSLSTSNLIKKFLTLGLYIERETGYKLDCFTLPAPNPYEKGKFSNSDFRLPLSIHPNTSKPCQIVYLGEVLKVGFFQSGDMYHIRTKPFIFKGSKIHPYDFNSIPDAFLKLKQVSDRLEEQIYHHEIKKHLKEENKPEITYWNHHLYKYPRNTKIYPIFKMPLFPYFLNSVIPVGKRFFATGIFATLAVGSNLQRETAEQLWKEFVFPNYQQSPSSPFTEKEGIAVIRSAYKKVNEKKIPIGLRTDVLHGMFLHPETKEPLLIRKEDISKTQHMLASRGRKTCPTAYALFLLFKHFPRSGILKESQAFSQLPLSSQKSVIQFLKSFNLLTRVSDRRGRPYKFTFLRSLSRYYLKSVNKNFLYSSSKMEEIISEFLKGILKISSSLGIEPSKALSLSLSLLNDPSFLYLTTEEIRKRIKETKKKIISLFNLHFNNGATTPLIYQTISNILRWFGKEHFGEDFVFEKGFLRPFWKGGGDEVLSDVRYNRGIFIGELGRCA